MSEDFNFWKKKIYYEKRLSFEDSFQLAKLCMLQKDKNLAARQPAQFPPELSPKEQAGGSGSLILYAQD